MAKIDELDVRVLSRAFQTYDESAGVITELKAYSIDDAMRDMQEEITGLQASSLRASQRYIDLTSLALGDSEAGEIFINFNAGNSTHSPVANIVTVKYLHEFYNSHKDNFIISMIPGDGITFVWVLR